MEKGFCKVCQDKEEEILVDLFGVKVCEGCYADLKNLLGYHNINDMLDSDKKLVMRFLNELAKKL